MNAFAKFFDVNGAAQHLVHLLQTQGNTALDLVRQGLAVIKAVTGRDFPTLFLALNSANTDVNQLIAAVKAEFALS